MLNIGVTGADISEKKSTSFHMTVVFEYFFEFSKNSKKRVFREYCLYLNADSEACGCGIDMIDGAFLPFPKVTQWDLHPVSFTQDPALSRRHF